VAVASARSGLNILMAVSRSWLHEAELAGNAASVADARNFVVGLLCHHNLPELVDDVELVVSELATNAIVHAETVFTVILRATGEFVVLEVRDGAQAGPVLRAPAALDINGRGIAIVQALSRDWGVNHYEAGGKAVWAEFVG
jgi:anti-sigma regulatory factor (Ser/Thr protein kinase)